MILFDPVLSYMASEFKRADGTPGNKEITDEKLHKVAREFESVFLYELLKHMNFKGEMFGKGLGGDVYETLFKIELSKEMAQHGTGLEKLIFRSLKRSFSYNIKDLPPLDDNTNSRTEKMLQKEARP